ncbi:hypothetical protein Csa_005703 [Cucumis sativus]|nr:hypothetical protein Csa_005703 [Cucumis sativus]
MGFPVGCTEVFFPTIFLHLLSLLDVLKFLILSLFRLLGLPEFLPSDNLPPELQFPLNPPPSALLLRELLPVVKFSDLPNPPERCAVCLYEFEGAEEIRTPFVPDEMMDEFNQRLWAASGIAETFETDFNSVLG